MESEGSDLVTLSYREYTRLVDDSFLLQCLRNAGVDNWEGFEDAINAYDLENAIGVHNYGEDK